MMQSDRILNRAEAVLHRMEQRAQRKRHRHWGRHNHAGSGLKKPVMLAVALLVIILIVAPVLFFLGITGLIVWAVIRATAKSAPVAPKAEELKTADLNTLPRQTELWLASQKRLLPASVQRVVASISAHLKEIAPLAARINPADPMAHDARKLIGEELPKLIRDYLAIPAALRGSASGPDTHLVSGLTTVGSALERLTTRLASADLDELAKQERFLDMKYGEAEQS